MRMIHQNLLTVGDPQAIDILLKKGTKTVIITSVEVGSNTLVLLGGTQEGMNTYSFQHFPCVYTVNKLLFQIIMCNILI